MPGQVQEDLVEGGTAQADVLDADPGVLQVNQSRPVLGPNALAGFDLALAGLDGLGLTGQEKVAVILAVDHYVTGTARTYILKQQVVRETGITDEEFWSAQEPLALHDRCCGCATTTGRVGRFYRSELTNLLDRLNRYLHRWATNKHKGLGRRKARRRLAEVARAYPGLFAHWKAGAYPVGWATGAV